jgi:hypothetical protein
LRMAPCLCLNFARPAAAGGVYIHYFDFHYIVQKFIQDLSQLILKKIAFFYYKK